MLATLAASLSPALIMKSGAVLGTGVVAEMGAAVAAPRQQATRSGDAVKVPQLNIGEMLFPVYSKAPEGGGFWPGVVLVHDEWGLSHDFIRMADALAAQGFAVFAPEINGGKIARDADKARELGVLMDRETAAARVAALVEYVKSESVVGDHRVAIVGLGAGGEVAWQAAMRSPEASGLVVAGAAPVTDTEALRRIACPILALFGGQDAASPAGKVKAFETAAGAANRTLEVKVYEEAGRSFMTEGTPAFNASASGDAWSLIVSFLQARL